MKPQNPFSLYDFLGYFIPGSFMIYFSVFAYVDFSIPLFKTEVEKFKFDSAAFYLAFIIAAYVIGHLISFISSYSIERYSKWRYGLPSRIMLGIPHNGYFYSTAPSLPRSILRVIMFIFLLPISLFDFVVGKILGLNYLQNRELDEFGKNMIRQNAIHAYNNISKSSASGIVNLEKEDYFTVLYHYVIERSKNHFSKIQNYVALYGFLRGITLCFIIIIWFLFAQAIISCSLSILEFGSILFLCFIAYISFLGFLKFYHRHFLEILMALTALEH